MHGLYIGDVVQAFLEGFVDFGLGVGIGASGLGSGFGALTLNPKTRVWGLHSFGLSVWMAWGSGRDVEILTNSLVPGFVHGHDWVILGLY